jgi:hypothetical protein
MISYPRCGDLLKDVVSSNPRCGRSGDEDILHDLMSPLRGSGDLMLYSGVLNPRH